MQIKEQWKGSKNWKLVTGVATAATLGFGAIAVAAPGSDSVPQSIDLNDRTVVSDDSFVPNTGSFVAFDDFSIDQSGTASIEETISIMASADTSAQDSPDTSVQGAIDDSISVEDSLDVSPQASIDDSISAQDDSFDDSVSADSFDDSDDSA